MFRRAPCRLALLASAVPLALSAAAEAAPLVYVDASESVRYIDIGPNPVSDDVEVTVVTETNTNFIQFEHLGGSPIATGAGCAPGPAPTLSDDLGAILAPTPSDDLGAKAFCDAPSADPTRVHVVVSLGDGATADAGQAVTFSGPGWENYNTTSTGGNGPDTFQGAGGNDTFRGAGGNDTFRGAGGGDTFQGAGGGDTVDYSGASRPVTAAIDADGASGTACPGEACERDKIMTDVENLVGTSGPDTLVGSTGNNHLSGGAGDDLVDGGAGLDTVEGGEGTDTLGLVDGGRDLGLCGSGEDTITADDLDGLTECEEVTRTATSGSGSEVGGSGGGGSGGGGSGGGGSDGGGSGGGGSDGTTVGSGDGEPGVEPSAVSANAPRAEEGHRGVRKLTFIVTMSRRQAAPVAVPYQTANRSAKAPGDFVAAADTLTFSPGQTVKAVVVSVRGDTRRERDETLALELGRPTGNAVLATPPGGTGTIVTDDKPRPRVSAEVAPRRDRTPPYEFVATGTIRRPKGVSSARGCFGQVRAVLMQGEEVVAERAGFVDPSCSYTVHTAAAEAGHLRLRVVFLANEALGPASSRMFSVRAG